MLSVAYPETPTAPGAPPARSAASLRRIAVAFAPEGQEVASPRRAKRAAVVSIPRYSRIIFRDGAVVAR